MFLNNNLFVSLLVGLIVGWLLVLSILFYQISKYQKKLSRGVGVKDLKTVLEKILKDYSEHSRKIDEIIRAIKGLEQDGTYHIQKIGLVRYNPYGDTGGNQSFCLAVLDNNDTGFIISSLHGRETTRLYAKPIKKGKALNLELSTEEMEAIKNAKKIK
jgi:hypothetical protein